MKTDLIFFIAIFIIAVLFIGHFRLTFSPFSISLPYWHRALGVVLIVAGCLVYNIGEHMSGYNTMKNTLQRYGFVEVMQIMSLCSAIL